MAAEEILEIVRGKRQEATAAEVAMGFDTEWKASFQRGRLKLNPFLIRV